MGRNQRVTEQLLDLVRLYVQSNGVGNSIDNGPGREPWINNDRVINATVSEWGTTDPAFVPGGSSNPSNCTLTRYANGDVLVTPNPGATVMRVTVVSRDADFRDYVSVRYTTRYDRTKQTEAMSWFYWTLQGPGSVTVSGSAGAAPANPANSTELASVANNGVPLPLTLTDTPSMAAMLTFTRIGFNNLVPVIIRAGTKVYNNPSRYMVETPVLQGPVQQITGDTISIVAQHGLTLKGSTDQLDPGVLKAIVKGADYEPGVNAALRPGSRVWLTARKTAIGSDKSYPVVGPAVWKLLWAGKVLNGDVDYEGAEPRVTIEATDFVADLANVPAPVAWGRYNPLTNGDAGGVVSAARRWTWLLYNYMGRLSWNITDTAAPGAGDGNPQPLDKDEGASLLTQLQRVRETVRGWFWIDPGLLGLHNDGTGQLSPIPNFFPYRMLNFRAGNSPPSSVPRYLATDDPLEAGLKYVALKTSFSARALCNAVTLHVHNANSDMAYGPYRNEDSIGQWGAQSDDVEIHELDNWTITGAAPDPAVTAQHFLRRYAQPQRYPSSVTFNVTEDLTPALDSKLYDSLRVKRNAPVGALDSTVRVLKITHTITADRRRREKGRWLLQLDTRPIEGTAAVNVTPPDATLAPNGQTTGGGSIEATQPIGKRYLYNSISPFANGAAVPWDVPFYAAGVSWDATNRWFVIPKAGRYLIRGCVGLVLAGQYVYHGVAVNGAIHSRVWDHCGAANIAWIEISDVYRLNAGDHVQFVVGNAAGVNLTTLEGAADNRATGVVTYLGG
jgi:hypothetical protein